MAAYIIVSYDVVDGDAYEAYVPGVGPTLAAHGAEVLVASSDVQALEGEKKNVYVVLRFDSDEAALNWYNDPAYQPFKKIRLESTANGNMVLAPEFVPPRT